MFDTNGPGLIESIKDAWKCGRKYFFHNLSCELRRGRHDFCIGYKNTRWDRFLFSLGVFVMDPFGTYFTHKIKWDKEFRPDSIPGTCELQWTKHPMPWISRKAKKLYT